MYIWTMESHIARQNPRKFTRKRSISGENIQRKCRRRSMHSPPTAKISATQLTPPSHLPPLLHRTPSNRSRTTRLPSIMSPMAPILSDSGRIRVRISRSPSEMAQRTELTPEFSVPTVRCFRRRDICERKVPHFAIGAGEAFYSLNFYKICAFTLFNMYVYVCACLI